VAEKLIRDRIPELAAARGDVLDVRVASDDEMSALLDAKLMEEVAELLSARTKEEKVDELVDVMSIVWTIIENMGFDPVVFETKVMGKAHERGWFDRKLVLRVPEPGQ
jgi:predicted house-cleaning noncanonical NTP pyrophosphatase (MazG superfamily)